MLHRLAHLSGVNEKRVRAKVAPAFPGRAIILPVGVEVLPNWDDREQVILRWTECVKCGTTWNPSDFSVFASGTGSTCGSTAGESAGSHD